MVFFWGGGIFILVAMYERTRVYMPINEYIMNVCIWIIFFPPEKLITRKMVIHSEINYVFYKKYYKILIISIFQL